MGSLFKGRFIQKTQEKKALPQNSQVWAKGIPKKEGGQIPRGHVAKVANAPSVVQHFMTKNMILCLLFSSSSVLVLVDLF